MPTPPEQGSIDPVTTFTGVYCTLRLFQPREEVVLVVIEGTDVGEFGDAPLRELERCVEKGAPVEIFVDARRVPSVSVDVSGSWAAWMKGHREVIYRLNLLCGSRFVEVTAAFIQRFTEFGPRMRIYTDEAIFDQALAIACGQFADGTQPLQN